MSLKLMHLTLDPTSLMRMCSDSNNERRKSTKKESKKTYLASRARAKIPAANGADAEVPV